MSARHPTPRSTPRTRDWGLWLCAVLGAWLAISTIAEAHSGPGAPVGLPSVRRFALVVGANDGGPERVPLQYATSDARAVTKVLGDIGGVAADDRIELSDPTPERLEDAFDDIAKKIEAARGPGVRIQFVFYYSGHSDEQGLLLGGDLVPYPELKKRVQSVAADVRIAILDSCASGAFTRLKGGTRRAPFLVGSSVDVKGHAFLTSSSADEAAQESERVGGSFFTHYLTTGLRGAADVDGDNIVTLTEAYEFAFDETLERTEATRGGPQHAAYDIELAGSGDLVMTDLRRTGARLEIGRAVGGRIFVRRGDGRLAAELYKPSGTGPIRLALEAGHYQVTVDDGEELRRADIALAEGLPARIEPEGLAVVERERTAIRGGDGSLPADDVAAAPKAPDSGIVEVPFNLGLFPPLSINGDEARNKNGREIRNRVSLSVLWSEAAHVDGIAAAFGATIVDDSMRGVQGGFFANVARGSMRGLQLSQGFNSAKELSGAQAGMANWARTIDRGVQLGFVNVAGNVRGVQLGLINYAESADVSLGVVGATKEYGVKADAWTSDAAAINVGVRVGARYTHTFLALGLHPFGADKGWLFGGGAGFHIPIGKRKRFFIDTDLLGHAAFQGMVVRSGPSGLVSLRLLFGYQPLKHLAVYAGPTVRTLISPRPELGQVGLGYAAYDSDPPESVRVRVWPGFAAGLRF